MLLILYATSIYLQAYFIYKTKTADKSNLSAACNFLRFYCILAVVNSCIKFPKQFA